MKVLVLIQQKFFFDKGWSNSKEVKIKLNRYSKFYEFLKGFITTKNISSVNQYIQTNEKKVWMDCDAKFDMELFLYTKNQTQYYKIRLYEDCPLIKHKEYQKLFEIVQFWNQFMKEHDCEKPYNIHTVQLGETSQSIAIKYDMDIFVIQMYNGIYHQELSTLNNRKFYFKDIIDGKVELKPNDKILIPCVPIIISEYEQIKE